MGTNGVGKMDKDTS